MQGPNRQRLFYALFTHYVCVLVCVPRTDSSPDHPHVTSHSQMGNNYFRQLSVINPVAQRALRDPQSMFVHRGVHRSWPSLLKIDFFLFSTRLGDFSIFEVTVVLSWFRRCVFVCIYIIKFVNDRLLCFSKLWTPGLSCASANSTST